MAPPPFKSPTLSAESLGVSVSALAAALAQLDVSPADRRQLGEVDGVRFYVYSEAVELELRARLRP